MLHAFMLTLKEEAVKGGGQELVKETIFEADRNIAPVRDFHGGCSYVYSQGHSAHTLLIKHVHQNE